LVLADAEILGAEIIFKRFARLERPPAEARSPEHFGTFRCPQCGAICCGYWEQFSFHLDRMYFLFDGAPPPAPTALYLIGFYGHDKGSRIPDFAPAANPMTFLASIGALVDGRERPNRDGPE
jgi:hypothetical protein